MSVIYINPFQFGGYDPDAQDYINRVIAADVAAGNTSGLEVGVQDAINTFVIGCKADGIWDAINASCILAGARTLAGALVPLVGTAPASFNFVAGDYNRETGLAGDGSTKYLDSNRASNADPQNSFHLSFYKSTTGDNKTLGGTINTPYDLMDTYGASGRLRAFLRSNDPVTSAVSVTSATGLLGASRSSSSSAQLRYSSTTESFSGYTSFTPATYNILIFARSLAGAANLPSDVRLSFYSIGESLDLALLDARVTTLMSDLAAAIP